MVDTANLDPPPLREAGLATEAQSPVAAAFLPSAALGRAGEPMNVGRRKHKGWKDFR